MMKIIYIRLKSKIAMSLHLIHLLKDIQNNFVKKQKLVHSKTCINLINLFIENINVKTISINEYNVPHGKVDKLFYNYLKERSMEKYFSSYPDTETDDEVDVISYIDTLIDKIIHDKDNNLPLLNVLNAVDFARRHISIRRRSMTI